VASEARREDAMQDIDSEYRLRLAETARTLRGCFVVLFLLK